MGFKLKFWGVRGSIACPSTKFAMFGGNTSCIEVSCGGQRVILDCGTGIRNLGHWMMKKGVRQADILMSHTHWDHINGFPFFSPAYQQDHEFRIKAGHLFNIEANLADIMAGQMNQPTFPVPIETMRSKLVFEDFMAEIKQNFSIRVYQELKDYIGTEMIITVSKIILHQKFTHTHPKCRLFQMKYGVLQIINEVMMDLN